MKINQLSIFLENKTGILNEVTSILAQNEINMRAFSVADGIDFGILRLIVSDVELAKGKLQEAGFKVSTTEVVCIHVPNVAGSLAGVLDILAREDVFIQYMYAFSEGEIGSTIIRPTDVERCVEILERNKLA